MVLTKKQLLQLDFGWFSILTVLGILISCLLATAYFEISVFLSGILCVGLIAIGRREGYLIGLYNSLAYAILAYENGLFGEMYLNLLFFFPTGIIGYLLWCSHSRALQPVLMRRLHWRWRWILAGGCVIAALVVGRILRLNPEQNTPFLDATTNVLSIVATFLMMGRYTEQWLLYILLNIITIVMWGIRLAADGVAGDLMVFMWSLFLLNSLFGYWRWHLGSAIAARFEVNPDVKEVGCNVV